MSGRLWLLSACVVLALANKASAQAPQVFDVSNVVVGAQRIATLYLYAVGKWSDAGEHAGPGSTDIQCYKSLGFCDVASANATLSKAEAYLTTYDILRWDSREMIAVDSSPICVVNSLHVDFSTKRITLSSADKGNTKDKLCKDWASQPTAVLWGSDEYTKDEVERARKK